MRSVIRSHIDNMNNSKADVMGMLNCSMSSNLTITGATSNTGFSTATSTNSTGTATTTYNGGAIGTQTSIAHAVYVPTMPYPLGAWQYWQDYYYPTIIRESYPVYIQERAKDKGKQAFEVLKMLQDKKILKIDKVSDFIDAMDALIKVL